MFLFIIHISIDILTKYLVIFVLRESLSIFFYLLSLFFLCLTMLYLGKDKEERK